MTGLTLLLPLSPLTLATSIGGGGACYRGGLVSTAGDLEDRKMITVSVEAWRLFRGSHLPGGRV